MGRKTIGLLFYFDKSWAGGYYYLLNILNALNKLQADRKPRIILFTKTGGFPDLEGISYDLISALPINKKYNLLERILRKAGILNKRYIPTYRANLVSFIYPYIADHNFPSLRKLRQVYWIPDFQHKYLSHLFSNEELVNREIEFRAIANKRNILVLSSESAKNDYLKFYPENKSDIHVIPFATILPDFSHISITQIFERYNLEGSYFISPNQFWTHKNHLVVLKAIVLLRAMGIKVIVVFTGNENDYRNPGYFQSLIEFVKENNLELMVRFLGFIDRSDQLQLMNNAIAVIQPSLFEGWSTVIEDAKAMNQNLIVSRINVHNEQCGTKALYFDPYQPEDLANIIISTLKSNGSRPDYAYKKHIIYFANKIIGIYE